MHAGWPQTHDAARADIQLLTFLPWPPRAEITRMRYAWLILSTEHSYGPVSTSSLQQLCTGRLSWALPILQMKGLRPMEQQG